MRKKWLLLSLLVALAVFGALSLGVWPGGAGDHDESEQSRESEILTRLAELDTGPEWNVASRDGSLMALLPNGWSQVPDVMPEALLTLSSGPVAGRIINPCQPGVVLNELPKGGVLVRISESSPPVRDTEGVYGRSYPPRPKRFRLGRPQPSECGSSYELGFRQGARHLAVSIWAKPLTGGPARGSGPKPGRLSPTTRRRLLRLLDGLRVQSAAAEPIRVPFLALDCRNPPNTLDCDRVLIHVNTRVEMKRLSARIYRWSAKVADGWVHSKQIMSLPTALSTGPDAHTPVPIAAVPRTTWEGLIAHAGLRGGGDAFERALPGPGDRWVGTGVGNDPVIRADVELIGPHGRWNFRNVVLIAGHG